jgi:hypothetical protein
MPTNQQSRPHHLRRLNPLRPRNLHHRPRPRNQQLALRMRRRNPPLSSLLHDDQDHHLLLPCGAGVHCAR